jgi:putative colanic acid biosynthesis acetyltransferase WcaF
VSARNIAVRRVFKCGANLLTPNSDNLHRWEWKNRLLRLAGIKIGRRGVAIGAGFSCLNGLEDNISIFDYAAIGHNVHIWNFGPVSIGKFSMITADASLVNGGHDKHSFLPFSGPLSIGHGCWIGHAARIIGPLTIGDNAIIGAGSVVIHDVEPGTIVAGVPARVIGRRELPEKVWHLSNIYFCPRSFEIVT